MPKKNLLRRFEPRYGVGESVVIEQAKILGREAEDYEALATSQVDEWVNERHTSCRRSWDEFQLLLSGLPEAERQITLCLLFRDFYHILVLYLSHLRTKHPELSVSASAPAPRADKPPSEFSEWLFQP